MTTRKRLRRSESGNVMIEFALLAPIFFMLVMGLVEFVLYEYKIYALNHVVYEAARNLQTGEVQTSADKEKAFKDEICARAEGMLDCDLIRYDVRKFDTLAAITFPEVEFDPETGEPENFAFDPGGPDKYSVVRASISHHFYTPFMNELFGLDPSNPAIVNSFCIVKNEPWA